MKQNGQQMFSNKTALAEKHEPMSPSFSMFSSRKIISRSIERWFSLRMIFLPTETLLFCSVDAITKPTFQSLPICRKIS